MQGNSPEHHPLLQSTEAATASLHSLSCSHAVGLNHLTMADEDEAKPAAEPAAAPEDDAVIGSPALRPIFLGNLVPNYSPERVMEIFEKPVQPKAEKTYDPLAVERIDQKRGYCFIFLKDAKTQSDKDRAEAFVSDLNGM